MTGPHIITERPDGSMWCEAEGRDASFCSDPGAVIDVPVEYPPLTVNAVITIGDIVRGCYRSARCHWLNDSGDLLTGTMRSIGDERGGFTTLDLDVRGEFVRITAEQGFDVFMPLLDAAARRGRGEFAIDAEVSR